MAAEPELIETETWAGAVAVRTEALVGEIETWEATSETTLRGRTVAEVRSKTDNNLNDKVQLQGRRSSVRLRAGAEAEGGAGSPGRNKYDGKNCQN